MGKKPSGFTLVEIMVVVFIIGLLASIVTPRLIDSITRSKQAKVKADFSTLDSALKMYRLDIGQYPSTDHGLVALIGEGLDAVASSAGKKYLPKRIKDPWGRPYIYELGENRDTYLLVTLGADGEAGGLGEDEDLNNLDE